MNLITFSALIAFTSELVHTEQLKNIKKKLLKVTDYYGFLDALNIPYYRPENEAAVAVRVANRMEKSEMRANVHDKFRQYKMADIKPGRDRCETTKVCLPTRSPMDDLLSKSQQGYEPGEQLYPFCYEVMQCRGSCCDEEVTCEPIESELIKKPVMRVVYDPSSSRFVIDDIYELEFRQDLSCSCGNCSRNIVEATECPEGKKVASSCACECENLREKIACKEKEGMWRWNEEECQCACEIRECRLGALLNYETCECEDDGE